MARLQALCCLTLAFCAAGTASGAALPGGGRRLEGAGGGDSEAHSAIAYGLRAKRGNFPYIAALADSEGYFIGCGGMLVRPQLVMTAAHCVTNDETGRLEPVGSVYLNMVDKQNDYERLPNGYEFIPVKKTISHPRFNRQSMANDIALLVLSRPARTRPVAMAPANFRLIGGSRPDWLFVAGWGATESNEDGSDVLLYGQVPYWLPAQCNAIFSQLNLGPMPNTALCAGWAEDQQDSCPGDSGGPLVKRQPNGQHVLVGIVSYGPEGPCGVDNMGAYTSVMAMRPWVDGQIKALRV